MIDIATYIKTQKQLTDQSLSEYLDKKASELVQIDPVMKDLISQSQRLQLRGGKRLRSLLFRLGYQLAGGTLSSSITLASLYVELMHMYILVHDDIADRDYQRYGGPTLEVAFNNLFRQRFKHSNPHFGISIAMVTGDMIHTLATQALLESNLNHQQIVECEKLMSHTLHQVIAGWYLHQLQNHQDLDTVTPQRYLDGMRLVSSSYTIEMPLKMGAMLTQSPDFSYKLLQEYAYHVGMAFQIQDDILGIFGETEVTGKPVGNDLREGKKTLLVLDAYTKGTDSQKLSLRQYLGTDLSKKDLDHAQQIIIQTGSLENSTQAAKTHVNQAKTALHGLKGHKQTKDILAAIADFVAARSY